jgi:spermidine synthase
MPHISLQAGLFTCAFLSGLVSLIYEVVWLRMVELLYGQTLAATGIVLAVFMTGLALGSAGWGRRADRSTRPLRLYGGLEFGAGLCALVVPFGLNRGEQLTTLAGLSPGFLPQFLFVFPLLLLPTVLLGGVLPVLGRFLLESGREQWTGALYGLSNLGAALGAFLSAFILLPALGGYKTNLLAAAMSCLIGGACLVVGRHWFRFPSGSDPFPMRERREHDRREGRRARRHSDGGTVIARARALLLGCAAASGFTALTVEVVWTRLLSLILENTVYAFSLMLTTVLLGLAAGSFLATVLAAKPRALPLYVGWVQWGVALSSILTVSVLPWIASTLYRAYTTSGFGESWPLFIMAQGVVCASVTLLPAALLGLTLPLIWRVVLRAQSETGGGIGWVLCANTLGALCGALGASFVLVPIIGLRGTLLLAAVTSAGAGTLLLWQTLPRTRRTPVFVGLTVLLVLGGSRTITSDLTFQHLLAHTGREVLYHHEDGSGVVEVVEDKTTGVRSLFANRLRQEGADSPDDIFLARQQGYLPVALHRQPERILFVGLGTGASLAGALVDRVRSLTVAEISPGIIAAARFFARGAPAALHDPRVQIVQADGRAFLRFTSQTYDVIVQDLFFPYQAGAGRLYAVEHYQRLRGRLRPQGVAVQWLPLNQLALEALRVIARTFYEVFPYTSMWLVGGYGALVGSLSPLTLDAAIIDATFSAEREQVDLRNLTTVDLLTSFVLGPERITEWVASAPLNTEDNGWIEYRSPLLFHALYGKNDLAVAALRELLERRETIAPYLVHLDARTSGHLQRAYEARTLAFAGLLLRFEGKDAAARESYERSYQLQPTDSYAAHFMREHWLVTAAEALQRGQYGEARVLALQMLNLTPTFLPGRFLLAQALLAEGEIRQALAELRHIEAVAPAFPGLQTTLHNALGALGARSERRGRPP